MGRVSEFAEKGREGKWVELRLGFLFMEINATRGRLGDKFLFYDQIALFPINSPKFIQNQYKQINKSSNIYFDVNCPFNY